ncbi:LrgA [Dyella sp.]|uniref:LrgA n=1 Tax=Dyella sp. TaxID=1869338 RepID=UPI002ED2B355
MSGQGNWNKVEWVASYFLLVVLLTVLIIRLGFASVWVLPPVDLALSWAALAAVVAAFWFGRHNRKVRVGVVVFASLTQLVPMVIRSPVLLLPILGAAIPVGILLWALLALSRKGNQTRQSTTHS